MKKERSNMSIKMLVAFAVAFLVSAGIGKLYMPWLNKHKFSQPIKDEVAQMYAENSEEEKKAEVK